MIFRESVTTRIDDFGLHGCMRPAAILKLMENTANHHMTAVIGNVMDAEETGLTWMLTEWRVKILRTPTYKDSLQVETWILGNVPSARSDRMIRITDGNGEELVIAQAKLALFDLNRGRVVMLEEEHLKPYQPEDLRLFEDELPRFKLPEACRPEVPVAVRRSDVDFNGHVHNTVYLDYAMELLPDGFHENEITSFRIVFRKSLKYGTPAAVKGREDESGWLAGICGPDGTLYAGVFIGTRKEYPGRI